MTNDDNTTTMPTLRDPRRDDAEVQEAWKQQLDDSYNRGYRDAVSRLLAQRNRAQGLMAEAQKALSGYVTDPLRPGEAVALDGGTSSVERPVRVRVEEGGP